MKKSTLVVFLLLSCFMSVRAEPSASVFGINNIVLKNFQAIQIPSGARVIWEFASEEKDVTCHLEKSSDGVTFTAVAAISVSSTREQAIHAYVDKDAAAGETFYRLRVTKESFTPFISNIVSVTISRFMTPSRQDSAPLPGQLSLFGELVNMNELMNIKLVALNGHAKLNNVVRGSALNQCFQPSFNRLPAGYYVLRVSDINNKPLLNRFIYKF